MIHFDISNIQKSINDLEKQSNETNFWLDPNNSSIVMTKLKRLQKKLQDYKKLEEELNNLEEMNELILLEADEQIARDILRDTNKIEEEIEKLELETLLNGKYDKNNAIITLHPGARRY